MPEPITYERMRMVQLDIAADNGTRDEAERLYRQDTASITAWFKAREIPITDLVQIASATIDSQMRGAIEGELAPHMAPFSIFISAFQLGWMMHADQLSRQDLNDEGRP